MGKEAYVMCIGPFKKEIADILEYPEDFYDGTNEGTTVIAELFTCNTDEQSIMLAEAFGIEPWDFNRHWIKKAEDVDWNALYELEERCGEWNTDDIDKLRTLFKHEFYILYRPEG